MKKTIHVSIGFVLAVISVFAIVSCVNPVLDIWTPKTYRGWPTREKRESYGILDMYEIPGLRDVSYTVSFDETEVTINFKGDENTEAELKKYFGKWTKEVSTSPLSEAYSRGITSAELTPGSGFSYAIDISLDLGAMGWPIPYRLREYHISGLSSAPAGTTRVSHLIELTHLPGFVNPRGFMLTLMIYGNDPYGTDNFDRNIPPPENPDPILGALKNYYFDMGGGSDGWYQMPEENLDLLWNELYPGTERPLDTYGYYFGDYLNAIVYAQNAPYYYEVDIDKSFDENVQFGWPGDISRTVLGEFGLHRMPKPTINPAAVDTDITYVVTDQVEIEGVIEDKMITVSLYGTQKTETDILSYFKDGTWRVVPREELDSSTPETVSVFSRGITYAEVDTSFKPYFYEIRASKDPNAITGWPDSTVRKKYRIHRDVNDDWDRPAGETRIFYTDIVEEAEGGGTENVLSIWFFGSESTIAEINNRFKANWCREPPTAEGLFEYSRGITLAAFDVTYAPYYQLTFTLNKELTEGWPGTKIPGYGNGTQKRNPGWVLADEWNETTIKSKNPKYVSDYTVHYKTEADPEAVPPVPESLSIRFFWDADEATVRDAFFETKGKKSWYEVKPDTTDPTYNADDYKFVTTYSRGTTLAEFDITDAEYHYYEITLTKNTEYDEYDVHGELWPAKTIREFGTPVQKPYGNNTHDEPSSSNYTGYKDYTLYYITPEDKTTTPATPEALTVRFYWDVGVTPANVEKTFFDSSWFVVVPDPSEQGYVPPEPGVTTYAKGTSIADFNPNEAPYYEITYYKEIGCEEGWPIDKIPEYGNGTHKRTTPITTPPKWELTTEWKEPTNTNYVKESTIHIVTEADPAANPPVPKSLTIRFYWNDTAANVAKYFFDTTNKSWVEVPEVDALGNVIDIPNVTTYSRGTTYAEFDITDAANHYYEITLTKNTDYDYKEGWPAKDLREKPGTPVQKPYGNNTHDEPNNSSYNTYADYTLYYITPEDKTTTPATPEGLTVRFYWGNPATAESSFFGSSWFVVVPDPTEQGYVPPEPGVTTYTKGTSQADFDPNDAPYYEITYYKEIGLDEGWPTDKIPEYGNGTQRRKNKSGWDILNNWELTTEWKEPTNSSYVSASTIHYVTEADPTTPKSLTIRFYWNANADTVRNYFFDTTGKSWIEVPEVDAYGNVIVTPNVTTYSRGTTYAEFDITDAANNYYEITLTKNTDFDYKEGWPGSSITGGKTYGNNTIVEPTSNTNYSTNSDYSIYYITPATTNPAAPASLTVRFYWNNSVLPDAVRSNFFGHQSWTEEIPDPSEQGYVEPDPNVVTYSRGTTVAEFDPNDAPYYEITFSKLEGCEEGWPNQTIRGKYGNSTKDTYTIWQGPSGSGYDPAYTTYVDDLTSDPHNLTIRFFWEPAGGASYVENQFFDKANKTWSIEVLDPMDPDYTAPDPGVTTYSRGTTYADFNPNEAPYYEITLVRNSDCEEGWPTTLIPNYGNGTSGLNAPTESGYVDGYTTHSLNPSEGSITIRFYWWTTSSTVSTTIKNKYFEVASPNTWSIVDPDPTDPDYNPADYVDLLMYSRGSTLADFNYKEGISSSYYEITLTRDKTYTDGWPDSNARSNYGISDWGSAPTGAQYIVHSIDPEDSSLVIAFNGASTVENNVKTYFTSRPEWEVPDVPTPGVIFEYSKNPLYSASLSGTAPQPHYELSLSKGAGDTTGWPNATVRGTFGIGDWNGPTTIADISYNLETTATGNELSIYFSANSSGNSNTTHSSINSYFTSNGWTIMETGAGPNIYEYEKGFSSVTYTRYPNATPEFVLEFSNESCINGWPTSTIWSKYGLTNLAQPSNTSNWMYADTADGLLLTFNASNSNVLNTVRSHFTSNANSWVALTTTNPYEYSKGMYGAVLIQSGSGSNLSFTLDISIDTDVGSGWPQASFWPAGITPITSGPASATNIGYSYDSESILIWFNGSTGTGNNTTQTQARNLFSSWSSDTTGNNAPFEYSIGQTISAVISITGSGNSAYFEIDISVDNSVSFNGWPSSSVLSSYGLGGWTTIPTGATQIGYDTTTANEVTIFLMGTSATELVIRNYLKSLVSSGGVNITETYSSSTKIYTYEDSDDGLIYVEFDVSKAPYYEICVSK